MLSKRQYELATGRRQKNDVIAYQIRQSFRPGEITAEEANKVGYELAMRFTKGKYAFIVATHTDREHIHNHIIYNSTALDGTRKFRDFFFSALAVQRLSDLICLEHQLSVIEIKPYRERQKRTLYPPKESNRDRLCSVIDRILAEKPKDYEDFLQKLEQQGYEVKRGKHTSVKGARQKRFIRFRTLGAGYGEEELKAVLAGEAEHQPRQKCPAPEQKFQMLVDIQAKLAEGKGTGFARWAKRHNLKEISRTLIFLQENKIGSIEEMQERVDAATAHYHELGDSIKASEKRLAEIAVLKVHIINYAKTRSAYDAYRKTGYSKHFLETHRTEITLHKAAKAAFRLYYKGINDCVARMSSVICNPQSSNCGESFKVLPTGKESADQCQSVHPAGRASPPDRRRRPDHFHWRLWRTGSDCYCTSAKDTPCGAVAADPDADNIRPAPSFADRSQCSECRWIPFCSESAPTPVC